MNRDRMARGQGSSGVCRSTRSASAPGPAPRLAESHIEYAASFPPSHTGATRRTPVNIAQPTMSRWENAPTLREIVKLSGVLIDLYCASYAAPPQAITLDIDDTCDVAHGHQQLSLFNAHYDERCFLPIHVYDTATGVLSQSFCVWAKHRPARKCAAICAGSSAVCARTGRQPRSPFGATAIMAAAR